MVEDKIDAPAPRKRGRPRTVTDDQQVPERRRKQLRVAQQAYRKRKETTIVNLQSRVQELESGIEELSESFLSFSNLLFESQVLQNHPRVTSALQKITQQCVSLAKSGCDEPQLPTPTEASPATPPKLSTPPDLDLYYDSLTAQVDLLPMIDDTFQSPPDLLNQWPASQQIPPTPPYQEQALLPFGIVLSSPNLPFISSPSPQSNFPNTISPNNLIKQGRWTLSHRIVRQCCEYGYHLLSSSSTDDPKIQAIFGKTLTIAERNRLISRFYASMHDESGDTIEFKTKVLSPLHSKKNTYSPEQLALSSRTWQIVTESGADEWLDASGVQKLIQERGIRLQDNSSPLSSPRLNSTPQLNVASFIRFLCLVPICVGTGPAFRKRDVENALRLATSENPWAFDAVCEIP